jgi:hypothetical protein
MVDVILANAACSHNALCTERCQPINLLLWTQQAHSNPVCNASPCSANVYFVLLQDDGQAACRR